MSNPGLRRRDASGGSGGDGVLTGGIVEPLSTERYQDVWEWSGDPATPAVEVRTGE